MSSNQPAGPDRNWLGDVEADALSVAVTGALCWLEDQQRICYGHDGWSNVLLKWRVIGRNWIESGRLLPACRTLKISDGLATGIAALSMLPGGVRVGGVVFCAAHFPEGREERWRFSCSGCDPDSVNPDLSGDLRGRNVTTIEGRL